MSYFSERLAELLFDSQMNAQQLGGKINVGVATISRWKQDMCGTSLDNLVGIADCFDCSLEYLAGRTDKKLDYTPKSCPPFYDSLRNLMKEQNISRYKLTRKTRFKDQHLLKWKNGANPRLDSLIELSNFFQVTLDKLIGRES